MTDSAAVVQDVKQGQAKNLALATLAFTMSFWAWNMIAPLGVRYTEELGLTSGEKSLLVATPVLVGSPRPDPRGCADRPVRRQADVHRAARGDVAVRAAGGVRGRPGSFGLLLLFGFFLGIGGTTFAVGIPFVNAWFGADRRGFATGVFGAGMGGTALSSFFTPRFVNWFGYNVTHVIIAVALVVAAFCWSAMRDSPQWRPNTDPVVPKLVAAAKLPVTWQMSFLYAVAFGGFVAFSTYLPTYLKDVYSFDLTQAGTRTAGFAIAAVIARPVGGVLADKVGPRTVPSHLLRRRSRHGDRGRPPAGARGAGRRGVRRPRRVPRARHGRRLRLGRRAGTPRNVSAA